MSVLAHDGRIRIVSPSRLHFSLLNETGLLGRVDGGIGISLCRPRWDIEFSSSHNGFTGIPLCQEHRSAIGLALNRLSGLTTDSIGITVHEAIPPHAGLGSKTSLLMAVGTALGRMLGRELPAMELARVVGRGGTSGIGVHSFRMGGFIWDAGHKYPDTKAGFAPSSASLSPPPQPILQVPLEWLNVVHFRFSEAGVSGQSERCIFDDVCPIPAEESTKAIVCVVSAVVPGVLERDEALLNVGIRELQTVGLKRLEWEYQSEVTLRFKDYWSALGMPESLGLSSFGPTLYVLTTRPAEILRLIRAFSARPTHIAVSAANNVGAEIQEDLL